MFSTVVSAAIYGVESRLVHVEADVSNGLPMFNMVGYLSTQVREAQERVRTALKNTGFQLEPKRITVNLAPADLKKSGTGFDLPIAIAIAAGYHMITAERLENMVIVGELSLDGTVHPIPGVLPIVSDAIHRGYSVCMVPAENAAEGAIIKGIDVIGVHTLKEAIEYLSGMEEIEPAFAEADNLIEKTPMADFTDINGQLAARRAAEVAVAGFHNLLMIGPPGSGKSLLAKAISGIMPEPSFEERLEISKIYSVAGLMNNNRPLMGQRPFRAPHHAITMKAMCGGGMIPKPGEVSLAHHGVLFLDELPEFQRDTLEALRQPLEEGYVQVSRTGGSFIFPANMMLVAAMNPCPCGYYPDLKRCNCTNHMVQRYLGKISAPMLDRIDITIEVPAISYDALEQRTKNESSQTIRERVSRARRIQEERYQGTEFHYNADLNGNGIETFCVLGKKEKHLMKKAFESMELSARSYHRILKVARTIADLENKEMIEVSHLQEALCYRQLNNRYWMGR